MSQAGRLAVELLRRSRFASSASSHVAKPSARRRAGTRQSRDPTRWHRESTPRGKAGRVEACIRRLVDALEDGDEATELSDRLKQRRAEKAGLTAKLESMEAAALEPGDLRAAEMVWQPSLPEEVHA